MSRMAESLCHIMEDDHGYEKMVDMYWLLGGFLDHVQKFHNEVGRLLECTSALLEREDPSLHKYLQQFEALSKIPFDLWFCSCFAGTISDGSIPKYVSKASYQFLN